MAYGEILGRALKITWRHKALWLFGFLASLFIRFPDVNEPMLPPEAKRWLAGFVRSPSFFLAVGGLVLFIALTAVGVSLLQALGRAGLVDQVNRLEQGTPPTVRAGWSAARRYGWRVFWIAFLLGLPVLALIMIGLAPLIATVVTLLPGLPGPAGGPPASDALLWSLAYFAPFCLAGALLGVFLGLINTLAERVCVVEDRRVWESIRRGWALLRKRFGALVVLWLILAGIHAGLMFVVFIPTFLLLIPVIFSFVVLVRSLANVTALVWIVGYLFFTVVIWVIGMTIGSISEPFFSGCWTLTYRQLRAMEDTRADLQSPPA